MNLLGHVSISYLLSQVPSCLGQPVTLDQQLIIFASGIVIDLDLLVSKFLVKSTYNHHYSPTHTPFFGLVLFLLYYILIGHSFPGLINFLVFISPMIHLALDDLPYWYTLIGLEKSSPRPQIFWFFPMDKRRNDKNFPRDLNPKSILINYYLHAPVTLATEILLILTAVLFKLNK